MKNIYRKIGIPAVIIVVIISSAFVGSFAGNQLLDQFFNWWCDDKYTNTIYSPDGKYYVQVLTSNCGGAAGDITTHTILDKRGTTSFTEENWTNVFDIGHGAGINTT